MFIICLKPLRKIALLLHTPFKKPPYPNVRYLMTNPIIGEKRLRKRKKGGGRLRIKLVGGSVGNWK